MPGSWSGPWSRVNGSPGQIAVGAAAGSSDLRRDSLRCRRRSGGRPAAGPDAVPGHAPRPGQEPGISARHQHHSAARYPVHCCSGWQVPQLRGMTAALAQATEYWTSAQALVCSPLWRPRLQGQVQLVQLPRCTAAQKRADALRAAGCVVACESFLPMAKLARRICAANGHPGLAVLCKRSDELTMAPGKRTFLRARLHGSYRPADRLSTKPIGC